MLSTNGLTTNCSNYSSPYFSSQLMDLPLQTTIGEFRRVTPSQVMSEAENSNLPSGGIEQIPTAHVSPAPAVINPNESLSDRPPPSHC